MSYWQEILNSVDDFVGVNKVRWPDTYNFVAEQVYYMKPNQERRFSASEPISELELRDLQNCIFTHNSAGVRCQLEPVDNHVVVVRL